MINLPGQNVRRMFHKARENPLLRTVFWILVSVLLLYLALRGVDLKQVSISLRQAKLSLVAWGVFSVLVNVLAKVARWQVLVGSQGQRLPFWRVLMVLMVGQTLNWFMPGRVGDLSRAYILGGMGPGRTFVLGTIAVEKVLDMLCYALLFLLLLILLPLPGWLVDSGYTFTALTLGVMLLVFALVLWPSKFLHIAERLFSWLPEKFRLKTTTRLQAGLASLAVFRQKSDLLWVGFWSIIVWFTAVWTNYLAAEALSIHLPWTAALTVLIVLQAGISIPATPGRFGIFQYLCILALAFFGVSQADGLSYGFLLQALVLIPTTLLSLPFFSMLEVRPQASDLHSL